jgi:O-antigen/teichoic acid export membrane protein
VSEDRELAKQVNRGMAWAGASQAIIAVADFVSQLVVLALWISAEELGTMMAAMAFYPALDAAADLGVASALIQKNDHSPDKVSTVFWFNVIISVGLFLALLGFGPLVGSIQGDAVIGTLISVYGIKLLLQNTYAIPFALLRKELRFADIAKMRTAAHLGESTARIVYAAVGLGVWTFVLAALTRVVIFGGLMQIYHPFRPKLVFKPREVGDYIRFGARASASQILYQLYTNIDYTIVRYFFGAAATGIYTLAYTIVLEPVRTITNVVNDVAFPAFARLQANPKALTEQFIRFTRLNLVGVLPFIVLILLVTPDFLATFWSSGKWTPEDLAMVSDCTRILCFVGVLRALGFLGPPLLDGVGRADLTLRYMVFAALATTTGYVLGAKLLGGELGVLSVAIAWATFYPLAFVLLGYLIVKTIDLPLGRYGRESLPIVACAVISWTAGYGAQLACGDRLVPWARVVVTGAAALAVMLVLLDKWQGFSFRTMKAAIASDKPTAITPPPPPPDDPPPPP